MNKLVPILILVLVVAGAAFWYQGQRTKSTTTSPLPAGRTDQTSGSVVEGGNAINVNKQEAGDLVTVDLTVLSEPGFVVIHKSTTDGKPGEVVGHSDYLTAGQHTDVALELDTPSKAGGVYFAMLHGDNGDKDYTSLDEDKPLKDSQGNVVTMKFEVAVASEQPED